MYCLIVGFHLAVLPVGGRDAALSSTLNLVPVRESQKSPFIDSLVAEDTSDLSVVEVSDANDTLINFHPENNTQIISYLDDINEENSGDAVTLALYMLVSIFVVVGLCTVGSYAKR